MPSVRDPLRFRVYGTPAPKGSRIAGTRKDGTIFTRPASKGEKPWVEAVAIAGRGAGWRVGPYAITLAFTMARPKKPSWPHPTRGDLDKLARATIDGLMLAGCIDDDRHVIEIHATKAFGAEPGVEVAIESVEDAGDVALRSVA